MSNLEGNLEVARYFTTKHSWRGKYKRIFSVGRRAITTLNPQTLEVTNQWEYKDFLDIGPNPKVDNEFIITVRKGTKKSETMRFSCDYRDDLLTETLRFRPLYGSLDGKQHKDEDRFNAAKIHWSERKMPVVLSVTSCSLNQHDAITKKLVCSYHFKNIEAICLVSDYPGGFVILHGGFGRMHMFVLEERDTLLRKVTDNAATYVGFLLRVRKESISSSYFSEHRLGKFSGDEHVMSVSEFQVLKTSRRHPEPVQRILALSETCLVERDPATYSVVTLRPLADVFSLIRSTKDPQQFGIEYIQGEIRVYTSTDRDALLASVLDGVRASGNRDVVVKMRATQRGLRHGPLCIPVEEEVESQLLKAIGSAAPGEPFAQAVFMFNANVSYSGLLHAVTQDGFFMENKEKLINGALSALLAKEGDQDAISDLELEEQFQALRRLFASKAGFAAFIALPGCREKMGWKVVKALKRKNDAITFAAIDMLNCLMQPMHDNYDLGQEQMNKGSLLSSKGFLQELLKVFTDHANLGTGALVISALLDFLTFALCAPYSETTESSHFDALLEMVADLGRYLFRLFQHPSMAIVKGAGLLMKAIIEEGTSEIAAKMQDLALAEGALPRHLLTALFTSSTDNRMLTNRQLSRHLVGLWTAGHPIAQTLLQRVFPLGLLLYLDSSDAVPEERDRMHVRDNLKAVKTLMKIRSPGQVESLLLHWKSRLNSKSKKAADQRPVTLRRRRQNIKSESNWPLFYYQFEEDHNKASLIWNFKTREELRDALETELRNFMVDRDLIANQVISWNHVEFEVRYESLQDEIKIGDYYLRLLLEEGTDTADIQNPTEFFNDLYHRFLLSPKAHMKAMCLQAMTIVYAKSHEEIGSFNDAKFMVALLDRSTDRLERDRVLLFIDKLLLNKRNVKQMLDTNLLRQLVELMSLAHLHISRATVPLQSNVIEAGADMHRDTEKEWYYGNKEKERLGPFSFREMRDLWEEGTISQRTRCWAQGMEGWKTLDQVGQLKWTLMAAGVALLNESELATLVLQMLSRMCSYYPSRDADGAIIRPLPRCKRLVSEANTLPHICQLLVTFEPSLVERVASLLQDVMEDNPHLPRLFQSGVFFFIMMYTGSNVMPIGKLLKATHLKQAFKSDEQFAQSSDIMQRSVLGQMLPEAMVHFLENHGPEKFAEVFLGDFDTPEAIWNNEMRRMMIEKIAAHLGDFTPRLTSNIRALYNYIPIPVIQYPQLEDELFCNIFYLRHLCDTTRFPDWPIKDHIALLKDILEAWKVEVEKQPSSMSTDEAYETLGLKTGEPHEESKIRKAYFKMAQKYHPDKNPDGREIFEAVNKAYEFLCSKRTKTDGPDPDRIVLILRAQSIVFKRFREDLAPYKYSGYPMLVKTIQLETRDDQLFSKSAPLLTAAAELCFHTVNCSALNAEELRRENGMEALQEALTRCVAVLSQSSIQDDRAVEICMHIARCFRVAAQFEDCREKFTEIPMLVSDLCRILFYRNLPKLNAVVVQTLSGFCVDFWLQTQMFQAGVLWHVLLFLFQYDYTLDESGVQADQETNKQEVSNELARLSIVCLGRLGGYLKDEDATPDNPAIKKALHAMLTPYLADQLSQLPPRQVLKLLNSNTENPYLIWDNATRAELGEFLETQQQAKIRTGECDPEMGAAFQFEAHKDELIIGGIFVRIYNLQPNFPLLEPKKFTVDLLGYLGAQAEYLHSLMALTAGDVDTSTSGQQAERLKSCTMALEALRNVLRSNSGSEEQCIGHFRLIFALLRMSGASAMQQLAVEVINATTANRKCVANIAEAQVLPYLLMVTFTLPSCRPVAMETLHALMANTSIVKEAMQKGALIYMLDLFSNSQNPIVREQAASLFSKMMSDKLIGPKVRIALSKFLPQIFIDAMNDNPEASVTMFEGNHENPELVWNDDTREKVIGVVKRLRAEFYTIQKDDPTATWQLPLDFAVVYTEIEGQLVVGGVILKLFIAQPNWVLRRPKEFFLAIMGQFLLLISKNAPNGEELETVAQAVCALFSAQPQLMDQVPVQGHIPKLFASMSSKNNAIPKACLMVVRSIADNESCVRAISVTKAIEPIVQAMKARPDCISIAAEGLALMYERQIPELVDQALKASLVQHLLDVLDSPLSDIDNPSAAKAQVVRALKAMIKDLARGDEVNAILEKSSVWSTFRDQRHDLFITNTNIAGYLQGPTGVAGYLTAGPASGQAAAASSEPPPMDQPDVPERDLLGLG